MNDQPRSSWQGMPILFGIGCLVAAFGLWMGVDFIRTALVEPAQLSQYQSDCNSSVVDTQSAAIIQARGQGDQAYKNYIQAHYGDACRLRCNTGYFYSTGQDGRHSSKEYFFQVTGDKSFTPTAFAIDFSEPRPVAEPSGPVILEVWQKKFTGVTADGSRYMFKSNPVAISRDNSGSLGIFCFAIFAIGVLMMLASGFVLFSGRKVA